MTVSALITRNDITATASQTSFTYTFRVLVATDMDVYQNGVLLSSGYTVNNVGTTTGGTVVLDTGVPVGQIVSLVLAMPLDRTTDYQNSGKFLADDVNGDFDKIYIGAIQNENLNDRSLRLQDVEPTIPMTLPLKADRKGKYLSFNSVTGAPEVVAGTGGSVTDASLVNYTPAGTGAVVTTVQTKLRESVSVKDFGAVGDGSTDDTSAIQAAINASNRVYIPRGTYKVSSTIVLSTNSYLSGDGLANTNIQGASAGSPSIIIQFTNASKANLKDLNVTWLGASDIGVNVYQSKKCNIVNVGGNFLNQNSGSGTTGGTFIKMNMGSDTAAYTHRIQNCDSQGANVYIDSVGPITGCIFADNKGRSANGFRFSVGSQSGTAPMAGNRVSGNLIQAYSAATFGTGVGIDFGIGDAASPAHTFAWYIHDNYIERWQTGILFRAGATNNSVGPNEYDNNTTDITDSTSAKDAFSQFAGTQKYFSLAEYKVETRPSGLRFTNKITNVVSMDGDKILKNITGNGVTVAVDGRVLKITGVSAPRSGAILAVPPDNIDGQICILTGTTWSVAFVTTNIDIASGFTMGNGSGQYSGMQLQWSKSNQKWIPIGSFLRP